MKDQKKRKKCEEKELNGKNRRQKRDNKKKLSERVQG